MSLRLRLFLAVTIVILVHTGTRIFLLSQQAREHAHATQQDQGQWVTRTLAQVLTNALITNDLATVRSTVELLYSEKKFRQITVLDDRGHAVADARPRATALIPQTPGWFVSYLDLPTESNSFPIDIGGVRYGEVKATVSHGEVIQETWKNIKQEAWLALFEIVLLSFLLWGLLEAGLRPLTHLSAAVHRIGAGDFGTRVKHSASREFHELINVVNDMSEKLHIFYKERKATEENIQRLNQELEVRVDERTKELESANERLAYQALHDALTHLPNRTLLYDRLRQAMLAAERDHHSVALMLMDLNRFKEINDTLGHHSGDMVLQAVASRITSTLRQTDTAARLGGDEFALVLPGIANKEAAADLAQKMLSIVQKPLALEGRNLDIGMSVGIALYPEQGNEIDTLLQCADAAMYTAKRSHSGYVVYSEMNDSFSVDRLALQSELRHAIENDQLELFYQPKIDCNSHQVSGVEALVRWRHPRHGLMLPDQFIPLAESTGLIKPLTTWVVLDALRNCCDWHENGFRLTVAVNISAINLQDPLFPGIVANALKETGAKSEWLELEITETAIMLDPALAIDAINRLHGMGVSLSIDDFGTGYSSMAYLQKLLVAKLKIDKSFVLNMTTNANDAVIVRSLIGLAHNLGLSVVAEGVENDEAWEDLKRLGCDSAQGFNMSHPIPKDELLVWLKQSPWGAKDAREFPQEA
ncbi:MAG: EAL domain-containing protein [Pseudomonadota bacterium]